MTILLAMMAAAATASPDAAVGRWQTETRHGVIEIARCGQSICGKLVDSDGLRTNPSMLDANNKDPKLRSRRLMGLQILEGFTWRSGTWSGGKIYNGEDGGTYNATINLADPNHLKLKGCIVWPLCKTQTWTRVH